MIIHLDRLHSPDLQELFKKISPENYGKNDMMLYGQDRLSAKRDYSLDEEYINKVFKLADKFLSDKEISNLLQKWMHLEHLKKLSLVLERYHAPLKVVVDNLKLYLKQAGPTLGDRFDDISGIRTGLISRILSENLRYVMVTKQYINIYDMDKILDNVYGPANGNGKVGGKAAGLILASHILTKKRESGEAGDLLDNVYTPKSSFITSDALYEFLHHNALEQFAHSKYQDLDVVNQEYSFMEYIFKNSLFPSDAMQAFNTILDDMEGSPLIVRSSSLLEDSFEAAFSGKYKSLFISNTGTKKERLYDLIDAVSEVYASTFGPDPIEYRRERGLLDFREEMGIIVQEVVGTRIGKYYMPSFAGVAFSHNEMRWSNRIKKEDGIIRLVAGLGTRAVDRTIDDYPMLVSPGQPGLRVNQSFTDQVRYSQHYIDVINMETQNFETIPFDDILNECGDQYPELEKLVSFIRGSSLVDPISFMIDYAKEDMVISFSPLLNRTKFVQQMRYILDVLQEAYGSPVDLEFASNGKSIYLLQCRPQGQYESAVNVIIPPDIPVEQKIFSANQNISNNLIHDIEYIVYVDPEGYTSLDSEQKMRRVGKIVGELNKILPKKHFILMGPGRWGSKGDIKLGVPVIYSDINNTAMLIEVAWSKGGYVPELSFGTHFFQDLVEANIIYLPLYPGVDDNIFNYDFFNNSENKLESLIENSSEYGGALKVIEIDAVRDNCKFYVYMDGDRNYALGFYR